MPRPLAVGSSLLLPRAWALLLRLLLQSGVPSSDLQAIVNAPAEQAAELEARLWVYLPSSVRTAWGGKGHTLPAACAKVNDGDLVVASMRKPIWNLGFVLNAT